MMCSRLEGSHDRDKEITEKCHEKSSQSPRKKQLGQKIADPHGMIFREKQYITLLLG